MSPQAQSDPDATRHHRLSLSIREARRTESFFRWHPTSRYDIREDTTIDILNEHCAGLDIHKKTIAACVIGPGPDGRPVKQVRTFDTMTPDLLALADWLTSQGVTHVAMESTGIY